MKTMHLRPTQIITLNDYPLYSNRVFNGYLERCKAGNTLPLVPVISKTIVRQHFGPDLASIFGEFEKQNPAAAYFMLDGSHRTTALSLSGRAIAVVIYASDADIREAKTFVASGQILENGTLDHTLAENCEILHTYFSEKPYFQTVQQKTEKLIRDQHIPSYVRLFQP